MCRRFLGRCAGLFLRFNVIFCKVDRLTGRVDRKVAIVDRLFSFVDRLLSEVDRFTAKVDRLLGKWTGIQTVDSLISVILHHYAQSKRTIVPIFSTIAIKHYKLPKTAHNFFQNRVIPQKLREKDYELNNRLFKFY